MENGYNIFIKSNSDEQLKIAIRNLNLKGMSLIIMTIILLLK